MMTTLARFAMALFLALLATSCVFDMSWGEGERGNGEVVEDLREIPEDFDAVYASEGIDVYITQGPEHQVRVEADENIIDLIGTRVKDGELEIYAIENISRATKNVYVSLPDIASLKASSGADLIAEEMIEADQLSLGASSGGSLKVSLNADETDVGASSGANLNLNGQTRMLIIDASSGANVRATGLQAESCRAEGSSGSNIHVQVKEELTANANSGANIIFKGDPVVKKNKSFSGNIRKN